MPEVASLPVVKPGLQTSEYKILKVLLALSSVVTVFGGALTSFADALGKLPPEVTSIRWVGVIIMAIGVAAKVVGTAAYFVSRTVVKVKEIATTFGVTIEGEDLGAALAAVPASEVRDVESVNRGFANLRALALISLAIVLSLGLVSCKTGFSLKRLGEGELACGTAAVKAEVTALAPIVKDALLAFSAGSFGFDELIVRVFASLAGVAPELGMCIVDTAVAELFAKDPVDPQPPGSPVTPGSVTPAVYLVYFDGDRGAEAVPPKRSHHRKKPLELVWTSRAAAKVASAGARLKGALANTPQFKAQE